MTQGIDSPPVLYLRQIMLALIPGLSIDNGLNAILLSKLKTGLGAIIHKKGQAHLLDVDGLVVMFAGGHQAHLPVDLWAQFFFQPAGDGFFL